MDEPTQTKKPRAKTKHLVDGAGTKLKATAVEKFYRDIVEFQVGAEEDAKTVKVPYTWPDPLQGTRLKMGENSPICRKCGLDKCGAQNPYFRAAGSKTPLITVICEVVTRNEDQADQLNVERSQAGYFYDVMEAICAKKGISMDDIRWVPLTRCASYDRRPVNYKIKGNWCRHYLVQDLMLHPPKLIMPLGTPPLGALCHKSNANDWSGRLLTYRGWPDDWLTNPKFMLPREDPADKTKTVVGHPLFGPPPEDVRIPLYPVESVRLIHMLQNPRIKKQWKDKIERGIDLAVSGVQAKNYLRSWYRITDDVKEIEATLIEITKTPGITVTYDTETTGLKPWAPDAAIVFMMFRWIDPVTKKPRSIGFPWDYESLEKEHPNRVRPHLQRLAPLVLKVLSVSKLGGHNLTFDVLYTFGTIQKLWLGKTTQADPDYHRKLNQILCSIADAACYDTWHMAYTLRQERGSLGLEAIAYRFAEELAGYEEDMTLLIDLHRELLHPDGGKGGHYANCPRDKWKTHLEPYVMGDVEVAHRCRKELRQQLAQSPVFDIPLAHPTERGRFRRFAAPGRDWVYTNIMSPAASVLMKVMGRGMFIDQEELGRLEKRYPILLAEDREKLRMSDPRIVAWCEEQERESPDWKFDLEKKDQLRAVLFERMGMPIQRLTKTGKELYGEDPEDWEDNVYNNLKSKTGRAPTADEIKAELLDFAALDKFTLNKLAVDFNQVRPLQEYRKLFKLHSAYVAPLRKEHLCADGCIHASFMLTGTRGGRLSCRNPNLQQLPRDGDVKSMFVSRFGSRGCLYQGDLSQIELRLLAAGCGDHEMVRAYKENVDLHTLTTSRIFNVPYENFEKSYFEKLQKQGRDKEAKDLNEKRQVGKTVNFLTGYGGGAFGLQTTLAARGIYKELEECEVIIESFFSAYPALKKHLGLYKSFIMDHACAVSIFGRVRIFEEAWSNDKEAVSKAMRAGCNHLIQSTASDMMLIALTVIESLMADANLESMLVSTVHDSLIVDAVRAELPEVHDIVNYVLNNFHEVLPSVFGPDFDTSWMIVPFAGDSEVGHSYHAMQSVGENPDWDKLLDEKSHA